MLPTTLTGTQCGLATEPSCRSRRPTAILCHPARMIALDRGLLQQSPSVGAADRPRNLFALGRGLLHQSTSVGAADRPRNLFAVGRRLLHQSTPAGAADRPRNLFALGRGLLQQSTSVGAADRPRNLFAVGRRLLQCSGHAGVETEFGVRGFDKIPLQRNKLCHPRGNILTGIQLGQPRIILEMP